jgi:hypothetical protein
MRCSSASVSVADAFEDRAGVAAGAAGALTSTDTEALSASLLAPGVGRPACETTPLETAGLATARAGLETAGGSEDL